MFEFADYMTLKFIYTLVGMVIVVVLMTEVAKRMVDYFNDETRSKYVAMFVAAGLMLTMIIREGDFSSTETIIGTIVWFLANTCVVWWTATGLYDEILSKILGKVKNMLFADLKE